jgi:uncharacterized protein YecE (DUF72 family)
LSNVFFGTSGWSYRDWIGPFYKKKEKSMLSAYSKVFKTAEIDSTFYRYPSKGMVFGWLRYSPPDFVFTAKLPGLITHKKKLGLEGDIEEDLKLFCELIEPLALNGKLGCVLIQLPPRFGFNLNLIEKFFKMLPANIKFAVEFRDFSWMRNETWQLLKQYEVAYTIVDEPLLPPEVKITSKIAYFRWHGKGTRPWYNYRYSVDELKPWIPKVKETADKVDAVYGYFNNHYHGYAVENCLQIIHMLGRLTSEQSEAKSTVQDYLKPMELEKPKLKALAPLKDMTLESILAEFMDKGRLKRAKQIKDDELVVQEISDYRLKAMVREYHIVIDVSNHEVLHDCADWSRCIPNKSFCKHIGKLILSLPKVRAENILGKIYAEKNVWEFKPYTE